MSEVLVTFSDTTARADGSRYRARACGREMPDGRWESWIEFEATDESGIVRSGRETTQPNRADATYWATGLTPVYLEGALARALAPALGLAGLEERAAFDGPRPSGEPPTPVHTDSVLNPFSVYRKGEPLLRQQLGALAAWHLVNIVQSYALSELSATDLDRMTAEELIALIVARVRQGGEESVER